MLSYWWLILVVAGIMFCAGAIMWTNAATGMVRVVAPSANWLERESTVATWGARLMTAAAVLAVISVIVAVG